MTDLMPEPFESPVRLSFDVLGPMQDRCVALWDDGWLVLLMSEEGNPFIGYCASKKRPDGHEQTVKLVFNDGADKTGDPMAVFTRFRPR